MMIKCLAIYPNKLDKEYVDKVNSTLELANKYSYNEIFTTIHLPELSLKTQLKALKYISKERKKYNLELTVDVGGSYICDILNSELIIQLLKESEIDFIRLDYGYLIDDVRTLYKRLNLKGFVLNASIFNEKEFIEQVDKLKNIDNNIQIRACHNFYVREETGLDETFAFKQDAYIRKYNIPIYYCIPSHSSPRPPLYQGLCTLEKHRNMGLEDIICDLYINHNLNAYMLADEWFNENEFKVIDDTLNGLCKELNDVEDIKVRVFNVTTKEEEEIILKEHEFRLDSPYNLLRSLSSRQMAEFSKEIEPNNTILRRKAYITIDNLLNKRYSGELQVVLEDKCEKVSCNVVGEIVDMQDLIKLRRFKEGIKYRFVREL